MSRGRTVFFLWLVTLLVALATVAPLFVHTFYFLSAVIAAAFFWSWTGPRGLVIERRVLTPRAHVGQYIEERFLLRNRFLLPKLWLEVRDTTELPVHRVDRVLVAIPPHRERGWSVRTRVLRRGRFQLGPLRVASGDPFGLFSHSQIVESYSAVTVYPYLFDVQDFLSPAGQLSGGSEVRSRTAQVTTNVMGLREYAPGDSVQRIHWLSSARHERLMVKEFELDPQAQVWVFLDLDLRFQRAAAEAEAAEPDPLFDPPETPLRLLPSTEEYAISAAASLARYLLQQGQSVGLATHGPGRILVQPDRGHRQLLRILDTLAVVASRSSFPFQRLLSEEGDRLPRTASVIAITSSWQTDWVAALKMLQRRGLRTAAIVVEAASFGPAEPPMRVLGNLAAAGIPSCSVGMEEDLGAALATAARATRRGAFRG